MNNFAPVLIPTLNRFDHFKRCINSLSLCNYADKTDLYIALDFPLKENHWIGYRKIEEYLGEIRGFNTINVIKRYKNYGAVKNLFSALSEIFKKYDQMILAEDDNVFSSDFLRFVNFGLDLYKNRDDVFSVSGYNYPIKLPENFQNDVYIWMGFSAWGVGIWKNKWEKINFSEDVVFKSVQKFLNNPNKVRKLNKISNHYIPALMEMLKLKSLHGDGYICMYQFINNMYSIFPTVSRVRNLGHDGSGVNCGIMGNDIYKEQEIYSGSGSDDIPLDIQPDEEINSILKAHWKSTFKAQVKTFARLLLLKVGLIK